MVRLATPRPLRFPQAAPTSPHARAGFRKPRPLHPTPAPVSASRYRRFRRGLPKPARRRATSSAPTRATHRGVAPLSPAATQSLIRRYLLPAQPGRAAAVPPSLAHLTDRERKILTLVARGQSTEQIAAGVFISPLTLKTHFNCTMGTLYAHDRAQLIVIA